MFDDTIRIKIEKHFLSDRSETFDVVMTLDDQSIRFHAYDRKRAHDLSKALSDAIDANTADIVEIAF